MFYKKIRFCAALLILASLLTLSGCNAILANARSQVREQFLAPLLRGFYPQSGPPQYRPGQVTDPRADPRSPRYDPRIRSRESRSR